MTSPKFEITGTVRSIPTPREYDGKEYPSFLLDIEKDSQYPQTVKLDCKVDLVRKIAVGDKVTVSFNLRGKVYANRTTGEDDSFTKLQAWKVDIVKRGDSSHAAAPVPASADEPLPF